MSLTYGTCFRLIFVLYLIGLCFFTGFVASKSSKRCGSVFITVSSLKGSLIELNWENTNCDVNDPQPQTIALYNGDIRKEPKDKIIQYARIRARNYPQGFFRTQTPFDINKWPKEWSFNSTLSTEGGPVNLPYWVVSYTGSNEIIDIQSLNLQPTWMNDNREFLKNQLVGDLIIPGTHDSGCYGGIRIIEDYVLTQDLPIWHQLVSGIRYLDLRVAYHQDGMFWINHDIVKVKKVETIFDQIGEFVRRSPKEIIIVDFHRFPFPSKWPKNLHEKFINFTLTKLGRYAFSKNEVVGGGDRGPTMELIWSVNKSIIFAYADTFFTRKYAELWDPIPQAWADTLNVEELKDYLEDFLNKKSNETIFNALMAELTPRLVDVFTGVNTLRELADDVNSNLTKWVRDLWYKKVNIVTSDFFLGNDLINTAIDINKNR